MHISYTVHDAIADLVHLHDLDIDEEKLERISGSRTIEGKRDIIDQMVWDDFNQKIEITWSIERSPWAREGGSL